MVERHMEQSRTVAWKLPEILGRWGGGEGDSHVREGREGRLRGEEEGSELLGRREGEEEEGRAV